MSLTTRTSSKVMIVDNDFPNTTLLLISWQEEGEPEYGGCPLPLAGMYVHAFVGRRLALSVFRRSTVVSGKSIFS